MIDLLSNTQFTVTCPSCNNAFSKRFRELETKSAVACPRCRARVPLDRKSFKALRRGRAKAP
jgi:DNA-directed RNA polymerase subunit RPC12/RpoP